MPYDLYGNHYSSRIDAENAEMAQMAAIDADIANRKVEELTRQIQQAPPYNEINALWETIKQLEHRISKLENNGHED